VKTPVLLLLLAAGSVQAGVDALLQQGAAAYREKDYGKALSFMAEALAEDPENGTAKNYVWTLGKRMADEARRAQLKPGELEKAERLALRQVSVDRARAKEALAHLKETYEKSRDTRSPADLLSGLEGLDREVETEFADERGREQARAYFNQILANLGEALGKNVFVKPSDALRASGYMAYYRGEWKEAASLWGKALEVEPGDPRLKKDLESLQALLSRRDKEEKIRALVQRAETFSKTGYWSDAAKIWREVLVLDPAHPGAKEKLSLAKVSAEKTSLQSRLKAKTDEGVRMFRSGDSFGAAQVWLEVLQEDPTHEQARVWLRLVGKEMSGRRNGPAAAVPVQPQKEPSPVAGEVRGSRKEEAVSLHRQAILLYSEDNLKAAVEMWRRALALDPHLAQAQQALRQAQAELSLQQ
jgi:tetratricopeptide (TPR) repeat protein